MAQLLPSQVPALALGTPPWTTLDLRSAPQLLQVRRLPWCLCAVVICAVPTTSLLTFGIGTAVSALMWQSVQCRQ